MAHSMDEVTLIDSFPTANRDEQGAPTVPAEEDVPLSRWGRGRVILKNYYPYGNTKEEQNEVDKAGSSPTPDFRSDQTECITTITGSSGATDNPYNAGYDQLTRYGKFPKTSGQKRERTDPAPPLYGVVTDQPYATTTVGMGATPPDYMCVSVLACLCCFWPAGLFAIYYASKRDNLVDEGKIYEATRMANNARDLIILSVVLGVICIAIAIVSSVVILKSELQP